MSDFDDISVTLTKRPDGSWSITPNSFEDAKKGRLVEEFLEFASHPGLTHKVTGSDDEEEVKRLMEWDDE